MPRRGWRRAVYESSAHVLNPGPSAAEQQRAELERRLRTPISGSRRVVVMSRKGGVGKTTISLALGSTFAMLRGDRVIAVDANPDAGNLAHRVAPPHDRNITDVLRDLDQITSYAKLRSYTSQAAESRLEVLASDDDPRIGMALNQQDYHRLVLLLDQFYNLILLDTGTGILDSANQGLLTEADQVVLVVRSGLDGGRAGALTLDWMDAHGFDDLVARAVVVVNAQRRGAAPPDLMRRHFEKRCQQVVTVPWDDALEQGALTDMSSLRRATRDSLVDIAAAVADNFVQMGDQNGPEMRLRSAAPCVVIAAALLVTGVEFSSPGAYPDPDPHNLDLLASAQPTTDQPTVTDAAFDELTTRDWDVKADAAATTSADCDGCVGESTALQIVYAPRANDARFDNSAIAWTQACQGCTGSALSVQVVVLSGGSEARPNNRAMAVTAACTGCRTASAAFQIVVVADRARRLSRDSLAELKTWFDEQAAALRASVALPSLEPSPSPDPTVSPSEPTDGTTAPPSTRPIRAAVRTPGAGPSASRPRPWPSSKVS